MSSKDSLLPVYSREKSDKGFSVTVPFYKFAWITLSLPFFSFLFCVIWSILFNFVEANATHCQVNNYLPSVSAAIGNFSPQKFVWMFAITLHFLPRIVVSRMYLKYFSVVIMDRHSKLYKFTWILNVCENCFLLGLTLIASTHNYKIHAFCFVSFLLTSILYMILSCYLLKFGRKIPPNNLEARTLKWKVQCLTTNLLCFTLAGYFFYRHNAYCEAGVYSLFALFEYTVVLTNMGFHMLAVLDFHNISLTISRSGIYFS